MARGTIHAVDENLFLVEGDWPSWPAVSLPGSGLFRSKDRFYLLDSGAGPFHRAAIRAVVASFSRPAELVLVNSGRHPGLVGNNDLLDDTPAEARRHLVLQRAWNRDFAGALAEAAGPARKDAGSASTAGPEHLGDVARWVRTVVAAYPPGRPTSVAATDLADCPQTPVSPIAGTVWTGWHLGDDLMAFPATAASARLAFFLPRHRTLLLPDELTLAPLWPGSDVADVLRLGTEVLSLLDSGMIDVVGLGFGAPLDNASARRAIEQLVDRAE